MDIWKRDHCYVLLVAASVALTQALSVVSDGEKRNKYRAAHVSTVLRMI